MKRILLYAHNGRTLGHIARMFALAKSIKRKSPEYRVLCVSGSSNMHLFAGADVDYVKTLAYRCYDSASADEWPLYPVLGIESEEMFSIRSKLLNTLITEYKPNLSIVDYYPRGDGDELEASLNYMRENSILIYGLRGIVDSYQDVEQTLFNKSNIRALSEFYHYVYCYCDERVFDVAEEYDAFIPNSLKGNVIHTGYVVNEQEDRAIAEVGYMREKKTVLITFGGGQGAEDLYRESIEAIAEGQTESYQVIVVLGPYLESDARARIKAMGTEKIRVLDEHKNIALLMSHASLVICAGGYNSLVELSAAGVPAVVIPRQILESEQDMHIDKLAKFMPLVKVPLAEARAKRIREAITAASGMSTTLMEGTVNLQGAEYVASHVRKLLGDA